MSGSGHEAPRADASEWHSLVEGRMSRRRLLAAAAAAGVAATVPLSLTSSAAGATPARAAATVKPTNADALVLPRGFRADVIAPWGSDIGGGLTAGFNHDWIGYYPIDLLERGYDLSAPHKGFLPRRSSSRDGLLIINHEYTNPLFVSGYAGTGAKTAQQIATEQAAVGMSVLRVIRGRNGRWSVESDDASYARRLDATSPCVLTGPASTIDGGPQVVGTLADCSGGATPWGTGLSYEENFAFFSQPAPTSDGWDLRLQVRGRPHARPGLGSREQPDDPGDRQALRCRLRQRRLGAAGPGRPGQAAGCQGPCGRAVVRHAGRRAGRRPRRGPSGGRHAGGQGNNALFWFPTRGRDAGTAYQFASGPVDCEMTDLAWTPDGQTLFLSVQHPGELSTSVASPTSRWPNGGTDVPRPASVAITGPWSGLRRGHR